MMDKKHRRYKKNIRRNAEALVKKLPFAFETGRERREFINDIVKRHPALQRRVNV